jgi:hypothetical protein
MGWNRGFKCRPRAEVICVSLTTSCPQRAGGTLKLLAERACQVSVRHDAAEQEPLRDVAGRQGTRDAPPRQLMLIERIDGHKCRT